MPDRLDTKSKELLVMDAEIEEDKNLRLKGMQYAIISLATHLTYYIIHFHYFSKAK